MVPIGETFNRFNRVLRDISRESGKEIELAISGAETELDKTVIEKISDPLMHLVRNAADHGLERPDERLAAGKPERGTVRLNAFNDAGAIVIEVADDGRGLNRAKILKKAVDAGLAAEGQELSDREVFKLIFEPGLSTAEEVTKLSGRGVGMDVVRRNIEALRGDIDIESTAGAGTTMRIRLPLTLAIIDGFMVGVASAPYVIPLDLVVECVELPASASASRRSYINLRGEVLPYIRLREFFGSLGSWSGVENVVVVQHGGQKVGLVVDELFGEVQTVIKSLGRVYKNVKGLAGATIMGDGRVALILDVPSLVQSAAAAENKCADSG
jgi:two-component system chemotaxis sensor kinase CheA